MVVGGYLQLYPAAIVGVGAYIPTCIHPDWQCQGLSGSAKARPFLRLKVTVKQEASGHTQQQLQRPLSILLSWWQRRVRGEGKGRGKMQETQSRGVDFTGTVMHQM